MFPIRLVDMKSLRAWECLASATGEALAEAVRKHHLPDFSHWKNPAAFAAAFAEATARQAGWEKICARASANEVEHGSVSRSTFKHFNVTIYSGRLLTGEAAACRRPALRPRRLGSPATTKVANARIGVGDKSAGTNHR